MTERTKKRKDNTNNLDKTKLWNIFDSEIKNTSKIEPLEYICGTIANRETCEHCTSTLLMTEDGFLTCTNSKCGIIKIF